MSNIIENLESCDIIKRGTFTLKSGQISNIYVDLKSTIMYPQLMRDISNELSKLIDKNKINNYVIGGVPYGGIPYAVIISQLLNIPMIIIRDNKKQYGMGRQIEGITNNDKQVILIEDVITTGGSVLQQIAILKEYNLTVAMVICILDRGGADNLRNQGYFVKSLLTLDDNKLFLTNQSLNEYLTINQIKNDYLTIDQIRNDYLKYQSNNRLIDQSNNRLIDQKDNKSNLDNLLVQNILNIIKSKETNIVLSLDIDDYVKALNILKLVGDYICGVKLHLDIMDSSIIDIFMKELLEIKRKKNFFVIEDRKYADIPFISKKQFNKNIDPYKNVIDMITVHGVCGPKLIEEMDKLDIGLLLVHSMSVQDNIINEEYSNKVANMIGYKNVVGFISQQKVNNEYLTFTPGINLLTTNDGLGQSYKTCEKSPGDIFIVGRGIYESDNIVETTVLYKNKCFEKFPLT